MQNDTGSEIIVGPDSKGGHFSVEPGGSYELPDPPHTVADDEKDLIGAEDPSAEDLPESDPHPSDPPPPSDPPVVDPPPVTDTEGAL